ncbi:MAG: hypothetical protein QUV05_02265 [Phycisphaerae bacterium]|nr:hypothetical protein [Phycisphaerae bacterium]
MRDRLLTLSASPSLAVLVVAALMAGPVLADWQMDDPYKMHYPQLPDPNGWDVKAKYTKVLADDWQCSETGPVEDVHFWGSWYKDVVGAVRWYQISIHEDIPDPDGDGPLFSQPGELLWLRIFYPPEVTVKPYEQGEQGWYDPYNQFWVKPNHEQTWQYNINFIPDPFIQEKGKTYWLDVSVMCSYGEWGWKTSLDHWGDDAVWSDYVPGGYTPWQDLHDPTTGESLDMAFVITPEPAAVVLLAVGSLLLRRRRV